MALKGNYIINRQIVAKYDPATEWNDFESPEFQRRCQRLVIQVLKEHNCGDEYLDTDPPYDKAIAKLRRCRKGSVRCLSPLCMSCMARFRRWYISHGLKAFEGDETVLFVTWVPEPDFPPTLPFTCDPLALEDMFQRRLERALKKSLCPADRERVKVWAFIEFKLERKLNCIVPHIHALISGCTADDLRPIGGAKWDSKKGKWRLPKDRVIYRPLQITKVKGDRMEIFTYTAKNYMREQRSFREHTAKRPEAPKRRRLREGAAKMLKKHKRFGFTKDGYKRYIRASRRGLKGTALQAEFYSFLAGLSVHDLVVLRRITRKHVPRNLDWIDADDQGRPGVKRKL